MLLDGKPVRACVQQTEKLEGKRVVTVEGLSAFEKELYTYAFGAAGAVQCGFCIPGMVLCTKALLDQNENPTEADCAQAIKNNICRCTGYVKIIKAMLLAAELKRKGEIPSQDDGWRLGQSVQRLDVREKVLGYGQYPDDVYLDGMIYASAIRSAYPRAKVLHIDAEAAKALPGVVGVFTADDIPGQNKVGHLKKDWDTMIPVGEITRYLGDAICIVAAETPELLAEAKKLVQIDYLPLPPVTNPYEAMDPRAPKLHPDGNLLAHKHIQRGHPAQAIAKSKHIITKKFQTPWTEHAFLEPECAVAYMEDDHVVILSADQGTYDTQHETAPMLGLPYDRVWVQNMLVGGGFGGKEDVSVQHHAALVAYLTGRPVKVKLTRQESILIHPKRHPMDIEISVGCDENGIIQGVAVEVITDNGAYASLGGPVLERACTHAAGPYNYQHFECDGWAYYTNNPPAGAFRGFGVTQTCFALESVLNLMADEIGISRWEIRWRNAIRPGQELPNGQIVDDSTGLAETLLAVKDQFENARYAGIACAMKNAGVGVGIPDTGHVKLCVEHGKVVIRAGASCIGQGVGTVLVQMVCTSLNLNRSQVEYVRANTYNAPDSGTTSGSRQTLVTGEACRRACMMLQKELDSGKTWSDLEGRTFQGEYLAKTDPLGADVPNPKSHVAYGYATQVCILDDDGKLKKFIAAHDVGKAINPLSCEGQIEGGVVMSLGYALTEQYPLEACKPTAKFGTLGLFRANQIPEIEAIVVEKAGLDVAYGAIGIGEITSIPTAPAVADAYRQLDGQLRTVLPLANTPYERKKK